MTKRSPLHEIHRSLGARMITFGGWEMPVSYSGIREEHSAVRRSVGLFDVSHMGEVIVEGREAAQAIQYLTCNDLKRLAPEKCQYTGLLNSEGKFIDDIIVYPLSENRFFLCVNAANTEKDFVWIRQRCPETVQVHNESEQWALLAIQGPQSEQVLQKLVPTHLSKMGRFAFCECPIEGTSILLSRTGYTGEDGFEIYVPISHAASLWNQILEVGEGESIQPCGLGARDTLRLEAAYPLYGHEISDEISPFEANLSWIVRLNGDDFIGKSALEKMRTEDPKRKLIGFVMDDPSIPRQGYEITAGHTPLGQVVSGTYSPTLAVGIGTGFVPQNEASPGNKIDIDIRGKKRKATVIQLPFYRPEKRQ